MYEIIHEVTRTVVFIHYIRSEFLVDINENHTKLKFTFLYASRARITLYT